MELYTIQGVSVSKFIEDYNLNHTQIVYWCKWKKQYGIPKQITGKRKGRPKAKPDSLEERLKFLEMENALLKKFNELLMEEETKRK